MTFVLAMANGSAAVMKVVLWYQGNPCLAGCYVGLLMEAYSYGLLRSIEEDECLPQSPIFARILVL